MRNDLAVKNVIDTLVLASPRAHALDWLRFNRDALRAGLATKHAELCANILTGELRLDQDVLTQDEPTHDAPVQDTLLAQGGLL